MREKSEKFINKVDMSEKIYVATEIWPAYSALTPVLIIKMWINFYPSLTPSLTNYFDIRRFYLSLIKPWIGPLVGNVNNVNNDPKISTRSIDGHIQIKRFRHCPAKMGVGEAERNDWNRRYQGRNWSKLQFKCVDISWS